MKKEIKDFIGHISVSIIIIVFTYSIIHTFLNPELTSLQRYIKSWCMCIPTFISLLGISYSGWLDKGDNNK